MMIERIIVKTKSYLPLKITEVDYNSVVFQMHGSDWHFVSMCAWRMMAKNKMILGCFDEKSIEGINALNGLQVLEIQIQAGIVKVDPVFILSNGHRLEIFSTDTYEPWTFRVGDLPMFIASPGVPSTAND
jgi:hypothetical protein